MLLCKKLHSPRQFSGADGNRLRMVTTQLVDKAERRGTFVELEVTEAALTAYYQTHDADKAGEVKGIVEKYAGKTAKLMRALTKKYGKREVE